MSITHHLTTAADAVAAARAQIAELGDRLWAAVGDDDLVSVVEQTAALRSTLAAVEARVLVELDHRHVPRTRLHWPSTTEWYAHTAGVTRAQAKRTLREAHDLTTDRDATLDALSAGGVSPAQAAVICRGVRDLPGDPLLRRRAETVLLEQCTHLDATDLTRAAARVLEVVDPDRDDRRLEAELAREERAAHAERHLAITDDGHGGVRIKGRGSLEDGALLRAALLPMTEPEPVVDPQTGEQTERDPRDPRDHGARLWDAFIGVAQHALDTDLPPSSHGTRPRVSVTIPLADLHAGLGIGGDAPGHSALTDDGLALHPATVRRLACDADIIPVVLGTSGEPLDVGRTHRGVTPALWRALVTRDRHCTFPGCTRPPVMCHAHHLVHWADGGPTALHNLALLCGEHHRRLHDTPWRIRVNPRDQHPEFLPPPRHRTSTHTSDEPTWIRHRTRNHPQRE